MKFSKITMLTFIFTSLLISEPSMGMYKHKETPEEYRERHQRNNNNSYKKKETPAEYRARKGLKLEKSSQINNSNNYDELEKEKIRRDFFTYKRKEEIADEKSEKIEKTRQYARKLGIYDVDNMSMHDLQQAISQKKEEKTRESARKLGIDDVNDMSMNELQEEISRKKEEKIEKTRQYAEKLGIYITSEMSMHDLQQAISQKKEEIADEIAEKKEEREKEKIRPYAEKLGISVMSYMSIGEIKEEISRRKPKKVERSYSGKSSFKPPYKNERKYREISYEEWAWNHPQL